MGRIPGHTTRAPPLGFELETNSFQFYAIANLDKTINTTGLELRSTRRSESLSLAPAAALPRRGSGHLSLSLRLARIIVGLGPGVRAGQEAAGTFSPSDFRVIFDCRLQQLLAQKGLLKAGLEELLDDAANTAAFTL